MPVFDFNQEKKEAVEVKSVAEPTDEQVLEETPKKKRGRKPKTETVTEE